MSRRRNENGITMNRAFAKLISDGSEVEKLQARIRDLEYQLKTWEDGCCCTDKSRQSWKDLQTVMAYDSGKQAGAEAALRWSWANLISTVRSPEDFVADGIRAVGGTE